ncbi:MAG TPA: hypothetical protein VNF69_11975 [Burkholderiales bacterium]|nr:hypothetical protein [Burkholderiales bacterium]
MALDADTVEQALELDATWLGRLRAHWSALAELAVWGRLDSAQLGALPRLRKRVLELGEKLAALQASRAWIPRPREQLKSALAAALAAKEALGMCEQACAPVHGDEHAALLARLADLRHSLMARLDDCSAHWARLLDSEIGQQPKE